MTDSCLICQTEAISLDDWYLKGIITRGKAAVIECICPWCVKDIHTIKELIKTHNGSDFHARELFDEIEEILCKET